MIRRGKRKSGRKKLENQLTDLWQQIVKLRDNDACIWDERKHNGPVHAHHIFHKSRYKVLKWDSMNGVTLCRSCHFYLHHGGEREFDLWFMYNYEKRWQYLVEKRHQLFKVNMYNLTEKLGELAYEMRKMQGEV